MTDIMISLLENPMERIILGNAIEVLKELPAESIIKFQTIDSR